MVLLNWIGAHWEGILAVVSVTSALVFNATELRRNTNARHIETLSKLTDRHLDIWTYFHSQPELARVLSPSESTREQELSRKEIHFVSFLLLNLNVSFWASKRGLFRQHDKLKEEIRSFFSMPVPHEAWLLLRPNHDAEFAAFVDSCLD